MWRKLIQRHDEAATFVEPATFAEITAAEERLNVRFPDALRDALRESNGVEGEYGVGLLWPVARIATDNESFRANADFKRLYMPFDHLLFFADAGNGDQFGFAVLDGEVRRDDIFVWNHEDDSRSWVAPSLEKFVEWWLTGRIQV